MDAAAERLAESLLYEGYALYPYTPTAVKNATPTPFGIVYPPAYARLHDSTYDHARIECVAVATAAARVEAEAVFLHAAGGRHRAARRSVALVAGLGEALAGPLVREFAFEPGSEAGAVTGSPSAGGEAVSGRLSVSAEELGDGLVRIGARVENATSVADAAALDRAAALRRSLLSTHLLLGVTGEGARFVSPLEREGEVGRWVQECVNVNSWPVLAAADDTAVLGASILLPDHPQVGAQSTANMFDGTEIEEALTLHVQALSDAERAAIAADPDPAVQEMIERVEATTPEQLLGMHGQMRPADPDFPQWSEPGTAPAAPSAGEALPPASEIPGERAITVGGRRFERGAKVVLRPGTDGDPYDRMLDGQVATVRRIYVDYDGRAYLGVTVDADPMSDVLRDAGRYLFFFADELEAIER